MATSRKQDKQSRKSRTDKGICRVTDEVVDFLMHLDEKTLTAGGLLLASGKLERLFGNFTVSWHHLAADVRCRT